MLCTRCGSAIRDGSNICSFCQTPVGNPIAQVSGQPIVQPMPAFHVTQRNRAATTGLIFGILSCVFSVAPYAMKSAEDSTSGMLISVYCNMMVLGIIFSAIGMAKGRTIGGRGKAVTGLILSLSSFLMFIVSLATGASV